jgi:GNAT superfamily N-acetyltransferase
MSPQEQSRKNLETLRDAIPQTADLSKVTLTKLNNAPHESIKKLGVELHDFNATFFGEEENDTAEDYETAIRKNLSHFYAIRDEQNNIVTLLNTQILNIKNNTIAPEKALLVWYVATDPAHQKKGYGTALYKAAYNDFLEESKKDNATASFIVGETENDVEGYLNKMYGRKRAYTKTADNIIEEIPYFCGPSSIHDEPHPGHLMLRTTDNRTEISTTELQNIVEAIYGEYTRPEYQENGTEEGRKKYSNIIQNLFETFKEALKKSTDGKILLLSKEERNNIGMK